MEFIARDVGPALRLNLGWVVVGGYRLAGFFIGRLRRRRDSFRGGRAEYVPIHLEAR